MCQQISEMLANEIQFTRIGVASWLVQVLLLSQLEIRLQDNHSSMEEAMTINLVASMVTGKKEIVNILNPEENESRASFLRAEFNLELVEDFIKVAERLFLVDLPLVEFTTNEHTREPVRVSTFFQVAEEFGSEVEEIERPGDENFLIGGFGDDAAILFGGTTFPQDDNTYLVLFGESTSDNRQWNEHDEVVKALKDGSVIQAIKDLRIG